MKKLVKFHRLSGLLSGVGVLAASLLFPAAAFAAAPYTCTWTGAGGDSNFSTAGNWSGCNGTSPQPADNDQLIFPVGAPNLTPFNDLTSATFENITFNGGTSGSDGYVITGNDISVTATMQGSINDQSTTSSGNELALNITEAGTGLFEGSSSSQLIIGDPDNLGLYSLTVGASTVLTLNDTTVASTITGISSPSTVVHINSSTSDAGVDLQADNPGFAGTIDHDSGKLIIGGQNVNATLVADGSGNSALKGTGKIKQITIDSGDIIAPGNSPGCLSATNLTLAGTYQAEIGGTTVCTGYDQLQVSGTVNVTGGTLQASLVNGFTPTVGQAFTIVDNQGGSPVTGTFSGLSEGTTFNVGSYTFKISYAGGDGNDIVLTVVSTGSASAPGAPNTGLAFATAHPLTAITVSAGAALTLIMVARRLSLTKL